MPISPVVVDAFETELGWMATAVRGEVLCHLSIGHPSRDAALKSVAGQGVLASGDAQSDRLRERLERYAGGEADDFDDVIIDTDHLSDFGRRVVDHCRAISYGETLTYGQLAAAAGSPGAARAVGNTMASNRFPLVVPCHRVVAADGLGGFSAPTGTNLKQRLLAMEAAACCAAVG